MEISEPRLRADACRNRRRILAAAVDALVEHGADVPLDEIARRAGVGNATLYRRFPDRRDLIRHVCLDVMTALAEEAEQAKAEEPDAFMALRRFAHRAVDRRVGAIFPLLTDDMTDDDEFAMARDRLMRGLDTMMFEALESGLIRPDVALGDLMVALTQLTRPLPGSSCVNFESFAHRHLELLLDGMRAPQRSELPGPAFTLAELHRACGHHTD
ncbi:TetR/AcrR family transcriptional regulator [Wenjunlia tyrosinilytica]|uniref:TetR family transcriptional regulator n=1 Tax=Wenjunlia tyrosinilytica TaxID=1544741 RepID=A0A917ZQX2_9ACTN|nr:TetR/AcrR family transcriptional regulator [Wenjunlia tyrosinilytica]GGO89158.1 TetR family transcriptional regulator [Wenjunlia tyrosinilytica]